MATLRELRRKALLTQAELARKAGITMETVSRLELGKHPPRPRTIRAIGKALKVDPMLIEFGGQPDPEREWEGRVRSVLTKYLRKKWADAIGKLDDGVSEVEE